MAKALNVKTVTRIVGDKVVFTATDADKLHCVNLKDGSVVWSVPRAADDL